MNKEYSYISVKIETDSKDELQALFEAMGLTLTTGIRIFLQLVKNTRSIPFEITAGDAEVRVKKTIKKKQKEVLKPMSEVRSQAKPAKTLPRNKKLLPPHRT